MAEGMKNLSSISLLSFDESEAETLSEWARGLDWVHWLMESVRHRVTSITFVSAPVGRSRTLISGAWDVYAESTLRDEMGPILVRAWTAARDGDVETLVQCDVALSKALSEGACASSIEAGHWLLRTTRGARYQGVLGKYRTLVEEQGLETHCAVVWAVTGCFFQLGLASVIAEYLHLEWEIATRHLGDRQGPVGRHSIAGLTSRMVHAEASRSGLRSESRRGGGCA